MWGSLYEHQEITFPLFAPSSQLSSSSHSPGGLSKWFFVIVLLQLSVSAFFPDLLGEETGKHWLFLMRVKDFHPSFLKFFPLAPDLFVFLFPSRLNSQWSGGKSVLGTEWLLPTPSSQCLALGGSALVMCSLEKWNKGNLFIYLSTHKGFLYTRRYSQHFTTVNLVSPQSHEGGSSVVSILQMSGTEALALICASSHS